MEQISPFKLPTVIDNRQGTPRKVGFELEFTGLDLNRTIAVVEEVFATRRSRESIAEGVVEVDGLGTFSIELDWHYLKQKAATRSQDDEPDLWLDLISQAAALLVPMEIVCPPIALNEMSVLDPLTSELRRAGAIGTEDSLIAAYGVHINTEIPHIDAANLSAYVRAFGLLQWWLVDSHQVDFSRRVSPYVDLYPDGYINLLLSRTEPDLKILLNDYLYYNGSRNRALDLLPLFAEVDLDRVQRMVPDARIKPRPAFHYRLPNCQIDKPGWSLADPWNTWWVVEELASRPDDLQQLTELFLDMNRPMLGVSRNNWTTLIDQWLHDRKWA